MELTMAHWVYLVVTAMIIIAMIMKKGVIILALLGTLAVAWAYSGNFLSGLMAIFNSNLVAAKALFNIFLIITFMVALLHALKDIGADQKMIKPWQKIMVNGKVSFLVLCLVTYVFSLFFWPTPAVALICTLLVPAAIRSGLPAMAAAMAVSFAGQGMALSSDYIMQVAPGISATAAGVDSSMLADKALVLSLITGVVAIGVTLFLFKGKMHTPDCLESHEEYTRLKSLEAEDGDSSSTTGSKETFMPWAKPFAILVPLVMIAVMALMFYDKLALGSGRFNGGGGAAFIGGVAALVLILCTFAKNKTAALDSIADHLSAGFIFAFRTMGCVIPIAGFFFLGSADFTHEILALEQSVEAPAFLFDLVSALQSNIPATPFFTAFGMLMVGIITGLDGSGFSGLPLTGALSGAMANSSGIDIVTLAAIGQIGSIWTGGGTIVAWSSLVAIAGFCGVSALDLARKSFLPVVVGLATSTGAALLLI